MQYPSRAGLVLVGFFLLASLSGCVTNSTFQPDAFGRTKTYAVVMVVAGETVGCSEPGGNPCSGGVSGLLRMATTTNAHSEDSTAVLESTYPVALRGLRVSPNLRIVPDEWVKAHPAYRAMPAARQPSGLFQGNNRTAKGYKKFSVENLSKLARELKVDGVIIVTLSYSALRAGMPVLGLGGKHKASTMVMVSAVDRNGRTVWFDYTSADSNDAVAAHTGGSVDFPKLRPLFADSTSKAVKKLMDNFNEKTRIR